MRRPKEGLNGQSIAKLAKMGHETRVMQASDVAARKEHERFLKTNPEFSRFAVEEPKPRNDLAAASEWLEGIKRC